MQLIRDWAFALCAAVVAGSILRILMPQGGMRRVFGLTLSVFILCCILAPFMLGTPELRLDIQTEASREAMHRAGNLAELVDAQTNDAAAFGTQKIVLSKLEEMGINNHGVTININHNSLWALITLGEEYKDEETRIRHELEEALGFRIITEVI